jgi:hypothetical protein
MQRPEFDIKISKTGRVTVEVKGAPGPQCYALADLIKEIIGREEERRPTAEYYAPDAKVRIDANVRDSYGG